MPNSVAIIQCRTILNGLERGQQLAYDNHNGHFYVFGMRTKPARTYQTDPKAIRQKVREFVEQNKGALQPELLVELQNKLAGRLAIINRQTSGFFALLCFLFSFDRRPFWDNKQLDDRAYLTDFNAFLENAVREIKQPPLPLCSPPSFTTLPTLDLSIQQQPSQAPVDLHSSSFSTQTLSPLCDHPPSTLIQTTNPDIIDPPPPSPSVLGFSTPPPPPPPAPFDLAQNPLSALTRQTSKIPAFSINRSFENEPIAPACLSKKTTNLTPEEITEHKSELTQYYLSLERILIPIKETLSAHAQLVKKLNEENKPHLEELKKNLQIQQKKLDLLNQASASESFISLYHQIAEIPFIPDGIFDEIHRKIAEFQLDSAKKNFKFLKLSPNFKISKAIEYIKKHIDELTAQIERCKASNIEIQTQIEQIEASSNNGIPFAQFQTVLNDKEQLVRRAKTQFSGRNRQVKGLLRPAPSRISVTTTEHPIFQDYPYLRLLDTLPQPLEIAMQSPCPSEIYISMRDKP